MKNLMQLIQPQSIEMAVMTPLQDSGTLTLKGA